MEGFGFGLVWVFFVNHCTMDKFTIKIYYEKSFFFSYFYLMYDLSGS